MRFTGVAMSVYKCFADHVPGLPYCGLSLPLIRVIVVGEFVWTGLPTVFGKFECARWVFEIQWAVRLPA